MNDKVYSIYTLAMTSPSISSISFAPTNHDEFTFRIANIDVSFVNALRRVMLSKVPTVIIQTKRGGGGGGAEDVAFEANTSRFHNEILKHRAGCIPVYGAGKTTDEMRAFCEKYELCVDVNNLTSHVVDVTTQDFQLRDRVTGSFLAEEARRVHFPPDPLTNDYILFARLRPQVGALEEGGEEEEELEKDEGGGVGRRRGRAGAAAAETDGVMPSEKLKFRAPFSIDCAAEDSIYNVVSTCFFRNTVDDDKVHQEWMAREAKLHLLPNFSEEEVEFAKRNFMMLDAGRIFVPNSFDFVVESLGMMSSQEILKISCELLISMFNAIEEDLKTNYANLVQESATTIPNSFDVKLVREDHTVGQILEYLIYEKYYAIGRRRKEEGGGAGAGAGLAVAVEKGEQEEKVLNYCAFKKFHPHFDHSTFRIGFCHPSTKEDVVTIMRDVCDLARDVISRIHKLFD